MMKFWNVEDKGDEKMWNNLEYMFEIRMMEFFEKPDLKFKKRKNSNLNPILLN